MILSRTSNRKEKETERERERPPRAEKYERNVKEEEYIGKPDGNGDPSIVTLAREVRSCSDVKTKKKGVRGSDKASPHNRVTIAGSPYGESQTKNKRSQAQKKTVEKQARGRFRFRA